MKTEITFFNGGEKFKYYAPENIINVMKQIEEYGFVVLYGKVILKVSKDQLLLLEEVE